MLLIFNKYELDTELFELRCDGQSCPVEPQVFDLLVYLIKHRDRIISRQELFDQLWAGKVVTESTLTSRIKAARHAVADNGREQNCIATFNRRGYRFIAEVKELNAIDDQEDNKLFSPEADRPSLAVLPFAHNHGGKTIAWTAEVLSEDISIQLARIPGFIVVSRNSTAYYRGREVSISQVGRELGTDYVIQGSVWELGEKLRISVQLLDTTSGEFLWTNRTDIPIEKLAEFQDDVVYEIAGRIVPELNRAELSSLKKRRPVDLGAWALYRQGHAILSLKGWSEASFDEATNLLRQAIVRDPELAFAHAYLSLMLAIGHLVGLVNDEAWQVESLAAAEAAIALDNQNSDVLGYVGCALVDMGEDKRGIEMIRRAIELDPSNAQAHAALGAVMLRFGQAEGIEIIRHGLRISPKDNRQATWGALLARGLLSLGKVSEAIEAASQACRCDDKIFLPRLVLAVAQNTAKNVDAARIALNDARRIRPQLAIADIARFASPEEIESLQQANLL